MSIPFRVFRAHGGGRTQDTAHFPFQVISNQSKSGIGASNLDSKCPCDTNSEFHTSSHFFKFTPGKINQSGKLAVKVFSGSMLYSSMNLQEPRISSYASSTADINTNLEKNSGVMRVFGLDYPIYVDEFLGKNASDDDTLKIWLTVCFPSGQPEEESSRSMKSADPNDFTLHDCKERANKPMGAFIGCGTDEFPKVAEVKLINKGTPQKPRYEKRQISANIPIAEVNKSGVVVRQYLNSNLTLVDMSVAGFPCKMPISMFSELG